MTIAVGIPCFKALGTIDKCLASVLAQTRKVDKVYLSMDNPGEDYSIIVKNYPTLDIEIIECDSNGGPGVARNRIIERCKEDYLTFIDADDVITPYAIELLSSAITGPNIVVSQAPFVTMLRNQPRVTQNGPDINNIAPLQFAPRNDIGHPWVFGRLYNVNFLKESKFNFSNLRQMEDGHLNACIRMSIEGTQLRWVISDMPVYIWNDGSEHSITRIHTAKNQIPVYNYGSCAIGSDLAFSMALEKVNKKNPFNTAIARTAAEMMVDKYFRYYEVLDNYEEFAAINDCLSCYWYHNVFKRYAANVTDNTLEQMYLQHSANHKHIPKETFLQWLNRISSTSYSKELLLNCISALPDDIKQCQQESGCTPYDVVELYM